ncbi:MAG: hypothetical protein ACLU0O_05095 [Collinsella sp.]
MRSAHSKGWKVGVVSGGFHEVADKIVSAAGIDFVWPIVWRSWTASSPVS